MTNEPILSDEELNELAKACVKVGLLATSFIALVLATFGHQSASAARMSLLTLLAGAAWICFGKDGVSGFRKAWGSRHRDAFNRWVVRKIKA